MHPDTLAAVVAALRAELAAPAYKGLSVAEQVAALNAPVVVAQAAGYRDVSISDVRGYLEARLVMVRLEDWIVTAEHGIPRDAARTLLRITTGTGLNNFTTSTPTGRANVLGLFALLVQAGAGGLTLEHYSEIVAMTLAPAGPAVTSPPRWALLIEGIGGIDDQLGPPNVADAALVMEAL